ncbi:MAG TPA: hypothetical protein VFD30_22135, partial [Terriglobia bacterium]|nr:hypothetical protein [Terriglobia bacterium]
MLSRRSLFKGLSVGLITASLRARTLWGQLIGSRYKFTMDSGPGPETVINGRRYLYFGGTGYFGFQTHPDLIQAAQK